MTSNSAGGSFFAGDGGPTGTVEFAAADDARTLRAMLEGRAGQPLSVTLAVPADADSDVEGHGQGLSVALTLLVGDDDTEGHAISVHFPTSDAAARFRRNLIVTGVLAGSIMLGTAGAVVISSQPGAPADSGTQVRTPVYERPAGRGALEGEDVVMPAAVTSAAAAAATSAVQASSIIDPATGRPADRGFLEGADGAISEGAGSSVNRPTGAGLLEGVDE